MSETKDASGVPLGEVPESIQRQRDHVRSLIESEKKPEVRPKKSDKPLKRSPEVVSDSAGSPDDSEEIDEPIVDPQPVLTTKFSRRPITLEHTLISFELEVLDFSVAKRFITVIFEKSVKMPEPAEPTQFKLHIAGRIYRVEHMGINFEIPTLGLRGVSFLMLND